MVKQILIFLSKLEKNIIAGLLFFNVAILFITVVLRYLFNNPPVWPEEASRYVMIWIVYLGVSQSIENDTEIKIDILTQVTNSAVIKKTAPFIAAIVGMLIAVFMLIYGIQFTQMLMESQEVAASFPLQKGYIYSIIPIAGMLMTIKYMIRLAAHITGLKLS
ncbi:TRAP transporter small permease subunit [Desulfobacula sp.]|uniref:TRAP transporter small permease n=1 Tax=Desulfobacula sp. TaxID=2593537 RepID=UPI002628EC3A|nr:TRAP transporter small permease subunit [Desulfobacula sp.]